jgi:hypothetical protein
VCVCHERHFTGGEAEPGQIAEATADIDEAIAQAAKIVPIKDAKTLIAVAGTATTVAAAALDLPEYDRYSIHLSRISAEKTHAISKQFLAMSRDARAALGYMHPGRVDVIGAGALVLSTHYVCNRCIRICCIRIRHPRWNGLVACINRFSLLDKAIVSCHKCPRLVEWREEVAITKRKAYENEKYWGKPVTGFGATAPKMLIVGLAPGAHGANRTGRIFTGDSFRGLALRLTASHRHCQNSNFDITRRWSRDYAIHESLWQFAVHLQKINPRLKSAIHVRHFLKMSYNSFFLR